MTTTAQENKMDCPEECLRHKYKIILAYDGTQYSGWQIQPDSMTIQQMVQDKLAIMLKHKPAVIGAGRTDAGVHAFGQTAHFLHYEKLDTFKALASLNGLLPRDIRVKSIETVSEDFHARFSAINKEYHYRLNLGSVQDPFLRLYSWHISENLDLPLMQECAKIFVGTHDFTSFANEQASGSAAKNPIRTIKRIDLVEEPGGVRLEFEGASFLYKMVRNLTGILVEVAKGKKTTEQISQILRGKDRKLAGGVAPARGLFLMRIDYPPRLFDGRASKEGK